MLVTIRTISPIQSPIFLDLGVDQFASDFQAKLAKADETLRQQSTQESAACFIKVHEEKDHDHTQYESTEEDVYDARLLSWQSDNDAVRFHVFSNRIAVVESSLSLEITAQQAASEEGIKELEEWAQQQTKTIVEQQLPSFMAQMKKVAQRFSSLFMFDAQVSPKVAWVSRTLMLQDQQLDQAEYRHLLNRWLKHTARPLDALDIQNRDKKISMTWLNYVVVDGKPLAEDPHIRIMALAQYYYTAQEYANQSLKLSIELAYNKTGSSKSEQELARTRTASRLNQIAYYEHVKFLNRSNRQLLESILDGWSYQELVDNSHRMIDVCTSRLVDQDNKRRERSTVITDLLLVFLSFFAVFELSLYLTEISREIMSRPALDFNDEERSFLLAWFANIDADVMFLSGVGLTLSLFLFYLFIKFIKRN